MNTIETLQDIGFTKNESRAYIALLRLGEAKSGELCKISGIPSSHIYPILDSLMKKGIVFYKKVNTFKVFKANDPESLNNIYKEKQETLEKQRKAIQKSIKDLKEIKSESKTISDYKYYEGLSGFRGLFTEIAENLEPGTEQLGFISKSETYEDINAFYLDYHKKRVKKKVNLRLILPKGDERFAKEREKIGRVKARYLDIDNKAEFIVWKDSLLIQNTARDAPPRGFLIQDSEFARSFKVIFEQLWKKAKA